MYKYLDEQRVDCHAVKRFAWVAPVVNRRNPLHSSEGSDHPGLKTQSTHHQKSKTGVSVAPKKD